MILDAAVRVFARQGFHTCRVSDIADEARRRLRARLPLLPVQGRGARHAVPRALGHPARGDPRDRRAADIPAREKLHAIASFIVDSYRHDPELMKVIIVEVTRAANSFGAHPPAKIARGLRADRGHRRARRRPTASFRDSVTRRVRRDGVLRRDRAGADRLDLRPARARSDDDYERAKDFVVETICDGLEAHASDVCLDCRAMTDNEMVKRLMWAGLLAGTRRARRRSRPRRLAHLIWVPRLRGRSARVSDQASSARRRRAEARGGRRGEARRRRASRRARAEIRSEVAETDARRAEEERKAHERDEAAEDEKLSRKERKAREKAEKAAAQAREARAQAERGRAQAHADAARRASSRRDVRPRRRQRRPASASAARRTPRPPPPRRGPAAAPRRRAAARRAPRGAVGAAFAGAFLFARILKRIADCDDRQQTSELGQAIQEVTEKAAAARARGDRARQGRDDREGHASCSSGAVVGDRSPASSRCSG